MATTHAMPKSPSAMPLPAIDPPATMSTTIAARARPTMPAIMARMPSRIIPRMSEPAWWQRGAIYQIYPRSFADANGDGVGDLKGITSKLDYLKALKVEGIWLSPIFTSPMADFGYDVSDYCDIDPVFGTLDDLDELVAECHARDLKLILDWVPNHSSDQHPWFQESRSSRENPKRDWYVWRDEPNDWMSVFKACGKAWTFDETTRQYYLHSFMPEQPDLNWDNPEVERAMHDVLRFWMDRGVDGLRLDAIAKIAKDPLLRDHGGASTAPRRGLGVDPPAAARHPQGRRRIRGPDDRGGGRAAGPAPRRRLPRVRRPAAPRAQLRLHRPGLGRGALRRQHRRLREAGRGSRLARLVSRQPRQEPPAQPLRPRRPRRTSAPARSS